MAMENRITTLEEVSQLLISALRSFNESMRRYEAAAVLRDQAMRELAESLERQEEIIQALQAFVPLTQAEIVRLDSRIDQVESE